MQSMFYSCSSLTSVPLFDTSNITDMTDAFKFSGVTEIPAFNTSNVTSMHQTFEGGKIVTVPDMDWGKVNKVGWTFPNTIVNLGVLQDFGKEPTITGTNSTFISSGTKLTKQSMLNLVNGLYDRASAGYSVLTLKVQTNNINLLTDEEIAIATNKGWILS
jgi:surface protein